MISSKTSRNNIPNLRVYSMDNSESKRVNLNTCSTEENESKIVHEIDKSVNMSKVKI